MEQFVNLKQLKYIYNISTAETILKGNLWKRQKLFTDIAYIIVKKNAVMWISVTTSLNGNSLKYISN